MAIVQLGSINRFVSKGLHRLGRNSEILTLGVSWDITNSDPTLTRTDSAVGKVANVGIDDQVVVNDFDSLDIYKDITEVTDAFGNVFVRVPKFYIKKTQVSNIKTIQISKKRKDTMYYLPSCFYDFTGSRELPCVDIGKYRASLDGSNRLESKSGKAPLVNKNIVDFRTYAQNNGAGYQQMDVHAVDVIRTLFYIEFATLNSQSVAQGFVNGRFSSSHVATVSESATNRIIIANAYADLYIVGQTISIGTSLGGNQIFYGRNITSIDVYDASNKALSFGGDSVDISIGNIVYNTGQITGSADGLSASSGSPVADDGKHIFSYRGIESPWGDTWCFIDGLNINDNELWTCDNADDYASNLFATPYKRVGYDKVASNGWASEMGFDQENQNIEIPISVAGGSTTYYSDYFYQDSGQRIALLGGYWYYGSYAGLVVWGLNYSSSSTGVGIGGRLLRKPL